MVSRIHKIHEAAPAVLERGSGSHRVVNSSVSQKAKFRGTIARSAGFVLYRFRRDGAMGLFLVLFWCSAVAGDALRYNSRFGGFNSRLSRRKFPFPPLRELAGKSLNYFTVLAAKTTIIGENRENSRFHGNNREISADTAQPATAPICVARADH